MSAPRDPDLIVADWLDDGPLGLPDQTRRAIVVALPTTAQRRPILGRPPRSRPMTSTFRFASAAMAVVVVSAFSLSILGPSLGLGGLGLAPTPSPTPTAVPTPSGAVSPTYDTTDWVPFASQRYGYDIAVSKDWSSRPSTRDWSLEVDQRDWQTPAADAFRAPLNEVLVTAFATPVPPGLSTDDWIATYLGPDPQGVPNPCRGTKVELGPTSVDGHPVTFWSVPDDGDCGEVNAFVRVADHVYVFAIWRPQPDALEAFLSPGRDSGSPSRPRPWPSSRAAAPRAGPTRGAPVDDEGSLVPGSGTIVGRFHGHQRARVGAGRAYGDTGF